MHLAAISESRTVGRFVIIGAFVAFTISGATSLLYQVVWQRILSIFSGADLFSVTLVVAVFMAGLGIGGLFGGRIADRLSPRASICAFGLAEFFIGVFAVFSDGLLYDWLYGSGIGAQSSRLTTTAIIFCVLLLPTTLMGASLPLLARALTARVDSAARVVGLLYGVNTFGAAIGAALTPWYVLRMFDFSGALKLGAIGNLCVAALALPLALWANPGSEAPIDRPDIGESRDTSVDRRSRRRMATWSVVYLSTGFIALLLEVLWFRILAVVMKSTAFTFGTLLAMYLFGLGVGSLLGAPLAARSKRPKSAFLLIQAALMAVAAGSVSLLARLSESMSWAAQLPQYLASYEPLDVERALAAIDSFFSPRTELAASESGFLKLFFVISVAVPFFVIGIPTILMGMSFPFLQRVVQDRADVVGRRTGRLQAANILGSMCGSFAAGWIFLPRLGTTGTLKAVALVGGAFGAAWVLSRFDRTRDRVAAGAVVGLCALGAFVVVPDGHTFWAKLHGTSAPRIVVTEDGTGLSVVTNTADDFSRLSTVFANGRGESSIPFGEQGGVHTILGALPALVHPDPRDVLLIGLGSGDTLYSVAVRAETRSVVSVEIVGSQIDVLREVRRRTGYHGLDVVLNDARIEHVVGDGRAYLLRTRRRFDVIEADALRPSSAYSGNLYSVEYFELVKSRLKEGGYAVTWAPSERIRRTFRTVFPHVAFFRKDIAFGSTVPFDFRATAIMARLKDPQVVEWFRSAQIDIESVIKQTIAEWPPAMPPQLSSTESADHLNRDLSPRDEFLVPFRDVR